MVSLWGVCKMTNYSVTKTNDFFGDNIDVIHGLICDESLMSEEMQENLFLLWCGGQKKFREYRAIHDGVTYAFKVHTELGEELLDYVCCEMTFSQSYKKKMKKEVCPTRLGMHFVRQINFLNSPDLKYSNPSEGGAKLC